MDANINRAYYEIRSDIANWHKLGEVKQGQKIQIDDVNLRSGVGKVSISAGAEGSWEQAIARTTAKLFQNAVADVSGTVQWLEDFQRKTEHDINLFSELIPNINNAKLIKAMTAIETLRDQIATSRFGLENLQMTYSGRYTTEGNDVMELLGRYQANSTKLLAQIDRQLDALINQKSLVNKETSTPMQEQQINEIIQGKGSINVEMDAVAGKNGDAVEMPKVVIQELHRLKQLHYNGQLLYNQSSKQSKQHVEAYKAIVEDLNSPNMAAVLLSLCGQAAIGHNISQCYLKAMAELGPISPLGSGLECSIENRKDEVIVTVKARVKFIDREDVQIEKGQIVTKREITIPKSSLRALDQLEYSQIRGLAEPLAGLKVSDSYSEILPTEALAIRMLKTI